MTNLKAKYIMFVILPTLQDFMTQMALDGLNDFNMQAFQEFLKKKTGLTVPIDWLEKLIKSYVNNNDTFMTILVMQAMDEAVEDLIKDPRVFVQNMWGSVKGVFNTIKGLFT